jgi:hypothetical protein
MPLLLALLTMQYVFTLRELLDGKRYKRPDKRRAVLPAVGRRRLDLVHRAAAPPPLLAALVTPTPSSRPPAGIACLCIRQPPVILDRVNSHGQPPEWDLCNSKCYSRQSTRANSSGSQGSVQQQQRCHSTLSNSYD